MAESKSRKFEAELQIGAPPEAVWAALTDQSEVAQWFAPVVQIEPGVGGSVLWEWGEHHHWPQTIEAWEAPHRLVTRYDSPVDDGAGGRVPLFMEFTLRGAGEDGTGGGGRTTLRLVHHGFGDDVSFDDEYDGISRGWPVELQSLRLYCERHRGQRRQLAWAHATVSIPPAEAWARVTGPGGFDCGAAIESTRPGAPFTIDSETGGRFEGTTLRCNAREFTGMAANFGDGFVRLSAEQWGGKTHVWLWLGAYDVPAADVTRVEERWDAMIGALFPPSEVVA